MKVLDLQCSSLHNFEGWFGSEEEFQSQLAAGLVTCPLCGVAHIVKKLSAPRLNLRGMASATEEGQPGTAEPTETRVLPPATTNPNTLQHAPNASDMPARSIDGLAGNPDLQALFVRAVREILRQTEDVGDQFATQARRMHHGDQEPKAIRGQATRTDTLALLEEGIDIMPLPLLPGLKETLQ